MVAPTTYNHKNSLMLAATHMQWKTAVRFNHVNCSIIPLRYRLVQ